MKRVHAIFLAIGVVGLSLAALGPQPRYIEELAIGGGYNDAVDGGADLAADGSIATSGPITSDQNIIADAEALAVEIGDVGGNPTIRTTASPRFDVVHAPAIGNGRLDFDANPQDGTSDATLRAGRFTNTSGAREFIWYQGDGSANEAASLNMAQGNFSVSGDLEAAGGDFAAGSDGGVRGVITAWDGAGGAAPGCIRLASPNGDTWYVFVGDDGKLRIHDALPSSNSDGTIVGAQY